MTARCLIVWLLSLVLVWTGPARRGTEMQPATPHAKCSCCVHRTCGCSPVPDAPASPDLPAVPATVRGADHTWLALPPTEPKWTALPADPARDSSRTVHEPAVAIVRPSLVVLFAARLL